MRRSFASRVAGLAVHAVLRLGAVLMILPMLWMVATSLKSNAEIAVWPPHFLPQSPTLANFADIFRVAPFARFFVNSFGISLVATISVAVTSLLAGAVFAKYR